MALDPGSGKDRDQLIDLTRRAVKLADGTLVFGRTEPGLQHRHQTWSEAI